MTPVKLSETDRTILSLALESGHLISPRHLPRIRREMRRRLGKGKLEKARETGSVSDADFASAAVAVCGRLCSPGQMTLVR
jgi:hypothetical protein